MSTPWLLLLAAIGIEVAATSVLPRSQGFRDPGWTLVVIAGYAVSIWLLTIVVRDLPVSVAYAAWSGLGTAGIALVGWWLLDESLDVVKAMALGMIVGGVLVLNLHTAH